jgi:hypothetical protein
LADIEQQQGQRFADITRLGGIMNPILERFRGAQDPGAGQRVEPFAQSSTIFLPDVQEETFTQTLNEGGPQAQPAIQTELFSGEEETGNIPVAPPNLQPREKVGGGSKKKKILVLSPQDMSDELGLGKIPTARNSLSAVEDYYIALTDRGIGDRNPDLKTKAEILSEIKGLLEDAGKAILNN